MRFSTSLRLLFLSRPKCGSETARKLLDDHGKFNIKSTAENESIHYHHLSLSRAVDLVSSYGIKPSECKVATIARHPYSMAVSLYNYGRPDASFNEFWMPDYNPNTEKAALEDYLLCRFTSYYSLDYFFSPALAKRYWGEFLIADLESPTTNAYMDLFHFFGLNTDCLPSRQDSIIINSSKQKTASTRDLSKTAKVHIQEVCKSDFEIMRYKT